MRDDHALFLMPTIIEELAVGLLDQLVEAPDPRMLPAMSLELTVTAKLPMSKLAELINEAESAGVLERDQISRA
jgi:hypothetical protein